MCQPGRAGGCSMTRPMGLALQTTATAAAHARTPAAARIPPTDCGSRRRSGRKAGCEQQQQARSRCLPLATSFCCSLESVCSSCMTATSVGASCSLLPCQQRVVALRQTCYGQTASKEQAVSSNSTWNSTHRVSFSSAVASRADSGSRSDGVAAVAGGQFRGCPQQPKHAPATMGSTRSSRNGGISATARWRLSSSSCTIHSGGGAGRL